ncbi:MAG TPA: ATP-binding protein [Chloroflexota bacterium]|nr:ATP-binding protein [Chloroflexota bacterium]
MVGDAMFRAIVEHAAIGVAVFDFAGNVLLSNPALQRVLGRDAATLRRLGFAEVSHPEDLAEGQKQYARLVAGEIDRYQIEKRFIHADGRTIWGRVSVSLVRGADGAPVAVVCFLEDVTEARQNQHAVRFLATASEMLASSLDYETTLQRVADLAIPDLGDWCNVYLVDPDGTIRQVALAARDPAKAEILRILGTEYLRPGARERAGSTVVRVIKTGQPAIIANFGEDDFERRARDARHMSYLRQLGPCSRIVLPLVARGRILGSLAIAWAESGRHYGPDDLALAEELARRCAVAIDNAQLYRQTTAAVQLRDDFLSVAAHELKTPITGVLGTSQFLLRALDRDEDLEPQRLRKGLASLERQASRLGRLVNQLLDVTRLDAGRLVLARQPTDVGALVEGVAGLFAHRSARHPIEVRAAPGVHSLVDPLRLEQVISNLIDNAIKYSPNGGVITVDVTKSSDGGTTIHVADQGAGIPLEQRARIFDRYYQAHAGSYLSGLGLGLYISRQIVEQHGGTLDVEFPPESGSRFVIQLPASTP